MNHESYDAYNRWHWIIALILLALLFLLPWLFNIGPSSWSKCVAPATVVASPSVAEAVAPPLATEVPSAPLAAAPAPVAAAEPVPAAKVYFAVNKVNLPDDVGQTLAEVVAYLKANPGAKAVLSGYHDPRGDVMRNKWLADNRAANVKVALDQAGISEDRLIINRAQQTTGTGTYEEARRVEVSVRQ
jgi:outer membrane protein OmpA-like peptidoglycan-associated protein